MARKYRGKKTEFPCMKCKYLFRTFCTYLNYSNPNKMEFKGYSDKKCKDFIEKNNGVKKLLDSKNESNK